MRVVKASVVGRHLGEVVEPVPAFRSRTGLPGDTPLRIIAAALVCSRCGARRAICRPRPYRIGDKIGRDRVS